MNKSLMTEFFKKKASIVGVLFSQFVQERGNQDKQVITTPIETPTTEDTQLPNNTQLLSPIKKRLSIKPLTVPPLLIQRNERRKEITVAEPLKMKPSFTALRSLDELEVIPPKSEKHHEMIIVDCYQFRRDSVSNSLAYSRKYSDKFRYLYKCSCVNCNCKVIMLENGFYIDGFHNFSVPHESSVKYNSKRVMNVLIRKSIEASPKESIKYVVNKIINDENYIPDIFTSSQLSKKISQIKNSLFKNVPKSIKEIDVESVYLKDLLVKKENINGNNFIIITSEFLFKTAQNYSNKTDITFFCDGTFKSAPLLAKQMWTIHYNILGYCFPLLFVLSEKRTSDMYNCVFNYIKENGINITNLMCDFEKSVEKAYKEVFGQESLLQGCLFHFCQSIFRKAQKLGLANDYYILNSPTRKCIRYLFALPLIKKNDILPFFLKIVEINCSESTLNKLLSYFYYNYVENEVTNEVNKEEELSAHDKLQKLLIKPGKVNCFY